MARLVEEVITRAREPRNGAGPFWAFGSPPLARLDAEGTLAVTVPETSTEVRPLCNTRLRVFARRPGASWNETFRGDEVDQREPCPVAVLPGGRLYVSTNPRTATLHEEPDGSSTAWYCSPRVLAFETLAPGAVPRVLVPAWDEPWPFTDHSYRGIASDPARGELLLLNIEGNLYTGSDPGRYHWCLMDGDGRTHANGLLEFPVRGCYPAVALRGRRAVVLAVSDIAEPNAAWAAHKRQALGLKWDYDFRRLFLAEAPDLGAGGFGPTLLVDSVEETAGHIRHCDLVMDGEGSLHVLYLRRSTWKTSLRDRFFPGLPIEVALCYAKVAGGRVVDRRVLAACREDPGAPLRDPAGPLGPWGRGEAFRTADPLPLCAALHAGPGGVRAVCRDSAGMSVAALDGARRRLDSGTPLDLFQAGSARNGSFVAPDALDLIGASAESPELIRYASIPLG